MGAKDRARILAFLRQHKSEMQSQFGVTRLGLVGSCARDKWMQELSGTLSKKNFQSSRRKSSGCDLWSDELVCRSFGF